MYIFYMYAILIKCVEQKKNILIYIYIFFYIKNVYTCIHVLVLLVVHAFMLTTCFKLVVCIYSIPSLSFFFSM